MQSALVTQPKRRGRPPKVRPVPESQGYLTPDEIIRFRAEAEVTYERFDPFDWKDRIGRKWNIRPAIQNEVQVLLIQCGKDGVFKEAAIPYAEFNLLGADDAIARLDKNPIWRP